MPNQNEQEQQPEELGKLLIQEIFRELKRFVEPLQPGEKPLVYIKSGLSGIRHPGREGEPKLLRADQLTVEQFMEEVYPVNDFPDYRDLEKAESGVMPQFDCYVVPVELNNSALDWSYNETLAGFLDPLFGGPDWDGAIDEALGKPTDPENAELTKVFDRMKRLLAGQSIAGPTLLPHYYVSVCLALDNYAEGWLRLARHQARNTEDRDKSPVEIFNEKFGRFGLRWGRMLTVRYSSYKPGILNHLKSMLYEMAIVNLGGVPELFSNEAQFISEECDDLLEDITFMSYLETMGRAFPTDIFSDLDGVKSLLSEYLKAHHSEDSTLKGRVEALGGKIMAFSNFEQQVLDLFGKYFDAMCRAYLGMSSDEFEEAYYRRIDWLVRERDRVIVDLAQRLGVAAMFEKNSYEDIPELRPLTPNDFPPGGGGVTPRNR